jgi:hypothetical protein
MSPFFSYFALSFGLMLLLVAVAATWLLRMTNGPLACKLGIGSALVALACIAPYQVNAMLGFPFSTQIAALPDRAELVAFVAIDGEMRADLWLRAGDTPPRAYEVIMDDKLKMTLREAQEHLRRGQRVGVAKRGRAADRAEHRSFMQTDAADPGFELDDSAFALPQKD